MKYVIAYLLLCVSSLCLSQTSSSGGSNSGGTSSATDVCETGAYPAQWVWGPQLVNQPVSATSGTPRIDQVRNGVVIATYNNFGGDAGYSLPNATNGEDMKVGPFRRRPYTQWASGDVFNVYPAVYTGANQQIYIGPNTPNDQATHGDIPTNITIRGITVNGQRPVIVNPPTGASVSNYNQSLVYVDGTAGNIAKFAANITIDNIDVIDSPTGGYLGKSAVYINGSANLTLSNMRISGFQPHNVNGILATGNNSGTLLFQNVELANNGGNNGPSHNAYISASTVDPTFQVILRGSWSHDAYYGHEFKSRAQNTLIEGNYFSGFKAASGAQAETYLLDIPDGGTATVRNNIFVKNFSGDQSNGATVTFAVESQNKPRAWNGLLIEHNTFVALSKYYDSQHHTLYPLFLSSLAPGTQTVRNNVFIGYCPVGVAYKDFRGSTPTILQFTDIDQSFHPLVPISVGGPGTAQLDDPGVIGMNAYDHQSGTAQRTNNAAGAKD